MNRSPDTSRPGPAHRLRTLSLWIPALLLEGCMVGQNYAAPDLSVRTGDSWVEGADTALDREDLGAWWQAYSDPAIDEYVGRALEGSLDLAAARERIISARARRGVRNADRLPTLDAVAGYSRIETGDDAVSIGGAPAGISADQYSLGVVAGWEIDLWGRVARLVEAADADVQVTIEDYGAARVAIAAEVAREVMLVRAIDERLRVTAGAIELDEDLLSIARSRVQAGLASELDTLRAGRRAARNRATLEPLRADRRAAEHRIAVLIGERPGSVSIVPGPMPLAPEVPSLGVPADLLSRRADIRSAERALASATAKIGAAEGERYPRVTLSGSITLSGTDLGDAVNPDARVLGLGPTVTLPVLTGGRIDAGVALARSEARGALARLEASALEAVREVETALARKARADARIGHLEEALASAVGAEQLASSLYRAGRIDFIEVLEARSELLAIEDTIALARLDLLNQTVDLYAALGGGWASESEAMFGAAQQD